MGKVALGNVSCVYFRISTVSIILVLLYIDLHFNNALIRRTSGRSRTLSDVEEHWTVKNFQVLFLRD
jgi:hypothetical protein